MAAEVPTEALSCEARLIVCLVLHGEGRPIVEALLEQWGITAAILRGGRGVGRRDVPLQVDIVEVVVEGDRADGVFAFICREAKVQERPGRLVYQMRLDIASRTDLIAPEMVDRD